MPDNTPAPRRAAAPSRPASFAAKAPPSARKSDKAEHEILFQKYFKSVGPRTYAAQVKRATNDNHYLVLTEGKRDDTGEVRKTRLFVYSEDFVEFFRMLHETAQFIKANPVPDEVKKKRQRFWAKHGEKSAGSGAPRPAPGRDAGRTPAATPPNGSPVSSKPPPGLNPVSRSAPKPPSRSAPGKGSGK